MGNLLVDKQLVYANCLMEAFRDLYNLLSSRIGKKKPVQGEFPELYLDYFKAYVSSVW